MQTGLVLIRLVLIRLREKMSKITELLDTIYDDMPIHECVHIIKDALYALAEVVEVIKLREELPSKNQNISTTLENLPEFLSSTHLVGLGIYKSIDSVYQARSNGNSPQFIKLAHKVLYSKQAVIEFLERGVSTKSMRLEDIKKE